MKAENNDTESLEHNRKKPRWYSMMSDFANMVKAFMGSNYLTIAYAFKQSGLVVGLVGLLLIAVVTDHCCHLIVKCKYHAIQLVLDRHIAPASSLTEEKSKALSKSLKSFEEEAEENRLEITTLSNHMTHNLTFGDIGKIACGRFGLLIVNACIIFTQFGFCIGYFIFVGNTLFSLFPFTNTNLTSAETEPTTVSLTPLMIAESIIDNSTSGNRESGLTTTVDYSRSGGRESILAVPGNLYGASNQTLPFGNISSEVSRSEAPDLRLLVISPIPIFVLFTLLRNIRHLGFVSIAANLSLLLGCVITLVYVVIGFSVSSTWELFSWTFPIFFGMVSSSYEGIGTIIPIESSMEGNRHNFPKFLHLAVLILTSVLTVFGIMGYLRNGESTEQMLNKHIPTSDGAGMAINIFLCVGIVLTFPLQVYPVIELLEIYIFGQGSLCGPKKVSDKKKYDDWAKSTEDTLTLLPKQDIAMPVAVAATVSDKVSAWKRNLLRLFIVLFAAGIAVLTRDLFAYVSAFIGAIGSSLLAYVLPCLFHLRLCWHKLGYGTRAKDILIIVFGIIASVLSLYTTILEVIKKV